MDDKEVTAREMLALLMVKIAKNNLTEADLRDMVTALGFDWPVVERWHQRQTGPLGEKRFKPGIVKRD